MKKVLFKKFARVYRSADGLVKGATGAIAQGPGHFRRVVKRGAPRAGAVGPRSDAFFTSAPRPPVPPEMALALQPGIPLGGL